MRKLNILGYTRCCKKSLVMFCIPLLHLHFAAEAGTVIIRFSYLSSDKIIPLKEALKRYPIFTNIH